MNKAYLLDTNIVSEFTRERPNKNVIALYEARKNICAISATSFQELVYGAEKMPEGKRKNSIKNFIENLKNNMEIIPYDGFAAEICGRLSGQCSAEGKTLPYADTQIAATAIANGMVLVTHNAQDFSQATERSFLRVEDWFSQQVIALTIFDCRFTKEHKMDFSYILKTAKILPEKLADFGFEKNDDSFLCRKDLAGTDFYVVLKLESENLSAEVFEKTTDERYVLFDVESAKGSFVCSVRKQVLDIIDKFREKCCVSTDVKKKYAEFIQERFGINGDNPWQETPEYTVFRCENKKWFALVMKIKFRQIGIFGDEDVFVVNLKSDCEKIPEIVDKKTVFPAWHMNKKYWITVLLTSATDWKKLCELTERSFELVNKKNRG